MREGTFPYRIERTKNRVSRASLRDGTVIIRLAKRLTAKEEQVHIESLLRRMSRVVVREAQRKTIDPFRPLLEGASDLELALPALGRFVKIHLEPTATRRTKISDERITLGVPPKITQKELHRWLWNALIKAANDEMTDRVCDWNAATLRVHVERVSLRHTSTQWGSCTTRAKITLNPSLLFVDPELMEYVIAHELAHRVEENHSSRFWDVVQRVCPNYEEMRHAIRKYRLIKI